jgi:hypothetical protein
MSDDSTSADGESERRLLAITGVGPALAKRLAGIGLGSLERLAQASAADIVERTAGWRVRPDHDRAQDWIDQARRLVEAGSSAGRPPTRAGRPSRPRAGRPRVRHSFTLEVQTDEARSSAVATRIVDVESQAFDTWSGWNPERIARFIASKSGLDVPAADVPAADVPAADVPAADVPAADSLWAYGVLESPAPVPGGAQAHVVLTLGPADSLAAPQQVELEWDLAVGPAGGQAAEPLARRQVGLVAGEPRVIDTLVAIPAQYTRARLVAVVRMLGPSTQPRVARRLSDSSLAVTADLPGTEVS